VQRLKCQQDHLSIFVDVGGSVQRSKCPYDDGCFAFVDVGGSVQRSKCQQDYGCFAFVDVGGSVQRSKCQQHHLSIYTQYQVKFFG